MIMMMHSRHQHIPHCSSANLPMLQARSLPSLVFLPLLLFGYATPALFTVASAQHTTVIDTSHTAGAAKPPIQNPNASANTLDTTVANLLRLASVLDENSERLQPQPQQQQQQQQQSGAVEKNPRERHSSSLPYSFWPSHLLVRKTFRLTCCMNGVPTVANERGEAGVVNFTYEFLNYVAVDNPWHAEDGEDLEGSVRVGTSKESAQSENGLTSSSPPLPSSNTLRCRAFQGAYYDLPPFFRSPYHEYANEVRCKCPEEGARAARRGGSSKHDGDRGGHLLDGSCRRLPSCEHDGFRSLIDPRKCLCLQPYFGDRCEKRCEQGQRHRGLDGRDYCLCAAFYRGEECNELICLNGGREEEGRCVCLSSQFVGYHCEVDLVNNRTVAVPPTYGSSSAGHHASSRFHHPARFGPGEGPHSGIGSGGGEMFTRDLSGTIFSLVMIVVLVVSMYLLMKHRMQVQSRYLNRRSDFLAACQFPSVAAVHGGGAGGAVGPMPPPPPPLPSSRRLELVPHHHHHHHIDAATGGLHAYAGGGRLCASGYGYPCGLGVEDGGPPPYVTQGRRESSGIGRRTFLNHRASSAAQCESLPPLPTYEDATKLPALELGGGIALNTLTPSGQAGDGGPQHAGQTVASVQTDPSSSVESSTATVEEENNESGSRGNASRDTSQSPFINRRNLVVGNERGRSLERHDAPNHGGDEINELTSAEVSREEERRARRNPSENATIMDRIIPPGDVAEQRRNRGRRDERMGTRELSEQ